MKRFILWSLCTGLLISVAAVYAVEETTWGKIKARVDSPTAKASVPNAEAGPSDQACWGQATRVFAEMGEMGQHASQQPTPRAGLRNLARALADAGIIPDDSMQSLGKFVSTELGLSIKACE